jgi:phospholipase C
MKKTASGFRNESAVPDHGRRNFLRTSALTLGAVSSTMFIPPVIQRALAIPANNATGTINDVQHIVILIQENRSFDHYFGTLKGVRGFGDPHPIPLASGLPVWSQSNGSNTVPPYHLNPTSMNALMAPDCPHGFTDMQAGWNQGKFGAWPQIKSDYSMGHFQREDIPFQFALAEAFTICDAYHCSILGPTNPNRVVAMSGSNYDPAVRAAGRNCTDQQAEVDSSPDRIDVTGTVPPGYTYSGNALTWLTIPEVLQNAGISWRIYQDPNDNWTGLMHGCLAFESFRTAGVDSPIYKNGMSLWTLDDLAAHTQAGTLPQVVWVLPSQAESEHPAAPSSPYHGGYFTEQVLNALTSNADVWSKTVFVLHFDENDGRFDHMPPPAVPSYNIDGSLAGSSTLDVTGEYISDPGGAYVYPGDDITGGTRPWGLGLRVPCYLISPWSKGGWVNSQVFSHQSVGMFIEQRFGVTIPAISPWHRAICGDLTSAFNFGNPNNPGLPALPDMSQWATVESAQESLPAATPPATPQPLFQEAGVRYSRALPYEVHTSARVGGDGTITLLFSNTGTTGAVFHVYDQNNLNAIPRRYTVEAGKELNDNAWSTTSTSGNYNLWVYGPNGFLRTFSGNALTGIPAELQVCYDAANGAVYAKVSNTGTQALQVALAPNAYANIFADGPWTLNVPAGGKAEQSWTVSGNANWYDFTVSGAARPGAPATFLRRFAGRVETGKDTTSDPAIATMVSNTPNYG